MFNQKSFCIREILGITTGLPDYETPLPKLIDYSRQECFHCNELVIYTEGKSEFNICDKTFDFKKGYVLFIPKGYSRSNYTVNVKEAPGFVDIYFDSSDLFFQEPTYFKLDSEILINLFVKAAKLWKNKKVGYYAGVMSALYEIVSLLQSQNSTYLPSSKYDRFKPAIVYMEENFYKPDFCISYMAKLTGFSYSYFKKLFIQKYGCPPVKHITNLRISLACDYLITQKYSISEIALMCGFEDVYYFSKTFKAVMGVSPIKFKKGLY